MFLKYATLSIFIQLFLVAYVQCENAGGRMYTRQSSCRAHEANDDLSIKELWSQSIGIPIVSNDKPKGYLGTIGILGGAEKSTGSAYFAAMAALRVGADSVQVFCTRPSAASIIPLSPDISVLPLADVDHNKMNQLICKNDVVLIGPGLELTQHSINLMTHLIPFAKNLKKPLIFDLDEFFLTQDFLNKILKYPLPGIILTMNAMEFEKFYPLIKAKNSFSDSHIHIDYPRIGENIFIYRKGCTDMGMALEPQSSWAFSEMKNPRRSPGQGSVIAGAASTYFHWALENIPANITKQKGVMLPAGLATYSAARLMRKINENTYEELGKSALTSDMVVKMGDMY